MAKFKVGDVCIILPHPCLTKSTSRQQVGKECVIRCVGTDSASGAQMSFFYPRQQVYGVNIVGSPEAWHATEDVLEKKKPPKADLGSWELIAKECGYKRPTEVTA